MNKKKKNKQTRWSDYDENTILFNKISIFSHEVLQKRINMQTHSEMDSLVINYI